MIEAYRKYRENGFQCLPVKKDKTPALGLSWKNGLGEGQHNGAYGIGLICGEKSGGLECLDFDNHFGDADEILKKYLAVPEVRAICKDNNLPIEKTMNGGYHLVFRCDKNDGNRKLAVRRNSQNRSEALIETRGEGGYFVAFPTPGYSIVYNDLYSVGKISVVDRAVLFSHAEALNEYVPEVKTEYESIDRPGDMYNSDPNSVGEMESLLKSIGWTHVGGTRWRRPGKEDGVSATLGHVAPGVFYVFSSNAGCFESMKAYSPFQVLALIKYDGDFSAAASGLVKPRENSTVEKPAGELEKLLNSSRIDTSVEVKKPPTILSIREVGFNKVTDRRLFTLGNFSCIVGKAKSRKTFLMTLFASAMISDISDKLIGETGGQVLYFDTEQGTYDCYNTLKRIEKMTGTYGKLVGFSLRQFSPRERCQIIEYAFKKYGGKIKFCVIDGIADLANAINDEDEATRVSTMLLRLTKVYNCHICTVIHQNKNDNFATGHLGSSIMKKAEILISVTKSSDPDMSEVSCDLSRGVDFESFAMYVHDGIPSIGEIDKKTKRDDPFYKV